MEDNGADLLRIRLTFWIATVGIAVVLVVFVVAVLAFRHDNKAGQLIPAVVGSVTATVGTLTGLVAGHTAGAAGKERAESRANANAGAAAAGKALAASLVAEETAASGDLEAPGATSPGDSVRRHAALARTLFPDL